jgi:chemotaxis protein CheX
MKYTEIIEEAVREIFTTMVCLDITILAEAKPGEIDERMLSGMIGLAGDLQGSVLIHLPEPVAIAITNAFLGLELTAVDEDVKDAVGELTNMVAGSIKYLLPDQGQEIDLAIPSVVAGRGYRCEATGKFTRSAVGFEVEAGRFIIEMQTKLAGG